MTLDLAKLAAPFPPEKVHWRVGPVTKDKTRGQALCYIDARDVMDRLDEAVGPANWQCEVTETPRGRLVCRIGINADGWIWKSDGAGDTDIEGEKGGISDAFKRAAVHWGIGRYLYRIPCPWVALENGGKKIAASEHARLQRVLPGSVVANGSAQEAPPPPERPHDPAAPAPEATTAAGNARDWTRTEAEARGKEIASSLRDHGGSAMNLEAAWSMYADEIMSMPAAAQRGLRKVYVTEMAAMTREAAQQELLA